MTFARFAIGAGALALIVWGAHHQRPAEIAPAAPMAAPVAPAPAPVVAPPAGADDAAQTSPPNPHRVRRPIVHRPHPAPSPQPQPCSPFGCLFH